MKRCLLVEWISSPDEAIDPLPASPKSDYLTIEYASQVFIVAFGGGARRAEGVGSPLIKQLQPIDQFIESIPELLVILPCGEIKDVVLHHLLHDPLRPGTVLPVIIQRNGTEYITPHLFLQLPPPRLKI